MIRLENVHTRFGERTVLQGIDLHVEKGETYVILGQSGVGKSVMLKHVIGLLRPNSGEVLVNGENINRLRGRDLQRIRISIGYVFQSGALINWLSVNENIALPLREHTRDSEEEIRARVQAKLELVHMGKEGSKMPDELSGGMKKRAGIARALILDPPIMLFDEPTAGLDPIRSRSITQVIYKMSRSMNVTSLMVTHNLNMAFELADRIGLMHEGRIVEEGSPKQITESRSPIVRAFLEGRVSENDAAGL